VVGRTPAVKEPLLEGGRLFWLEQRPHEKGRTTLLVKPSPSVSGNPNPQSLELTPGNWNLRSRVHEYGGGVFTVSGGDVVLVHDGDRCLYHLRVDPADTPLTQPKRLLPPGDRAFADGLIDPVRQRWVGVMEADGRDHLVAVPLAGGEPIALHEPADFCGYASLSPDGHWLAWVEWQQPCMPWERSQLWLARINASGALEQAKPIAGSSPVKAISVFQPLWITTKTGDPALVVASDASGWWNLQRLDPNSGQGQTLLEMAAEFAMPQWVYGMRTTAWDGEQLVAAACCQGQWQLGLVATEGPPHWQPMAQPFTDLAGLSAEAGRLVCVASNPSTPSGLLELEIASGLWQHTPAAPSPLDPAAISQPQQLWFPGHGDHPTHAWYYPPYNGGNPEAPLLVKGHSGPTGMARTGLSLGIQFWTSRGWGVVDVNYGGSTGFGRAYRERLDGQWGIVDVTDCAAAAQAVVAQGWAAATRIAIEGGSAGGFTALAALCFTDVFRAGASRYGVADLGALARETHRFEARYLDGLIGPWPAAQATYAARSPLQHAERIRCPVIFFQGLDDNVVPPAQTEAMAEALRSQAIPVEVHLFTGEGHGFKSSDTQIQVLECTEAFFAKHFGLQAT
jgi:dipeptidyl aminopeptidase/acylaminoacyl peptidase